MAKPPLLAWPVNWIRNICYELDLFWCTGKAVKNCIAVARVKALWCRSRLGLVGFLTSRVLLVGRVTKATCDVLLGSVPDCCAWGRCLHSCLWHFCSRPYGKAYSFSLSSLVAGILHPGSTILRAMAGVGPEGFWAYGLWSH